MSEGKLRRTRHDPHVRVRYEMEPWVLAPDASLIPDRQNDPRDQQDTANVHPGRLPTHGAAAQNVEALEEPDAADE